MATGKVIVSKDKIGNWLYTFSTTSPAAVPVEDSSDLDLKKITQTVSSIKTWLKTKPTIEDVAEVIAYEEKHENRTSAVGESGCLTNYLSGE